MELFVLQKDNSLVVSFKNLKFMKKLVLFFAIAIMATLNMVAQNCVAKTEIFENKTLADMEAEFKSWEYAQCDKVTMLKSADFCVVSMVFGQIPYGLFVAYQTKDNKVVRLWLNPQNRYSEVIETQGGNYSLNVHGRIEIYAFPIEKYVPLIAISERGKISVSGNISYENL